MNRREYLTALDIALTGLVPPEERADILQYYEEYFDDAGPEREADLIQALGDPVALARKIAREGGYGGGAEGQRRRRLPVWLIVLLAALVIIVALAVQLAASFSAAKNQGSSFWGTGPAQTYMVVNGGEEAMLNQFRSVDVDVDLAEVMVEAGGEFAVSLFWPEDADYSMSYRIEDGVLKITSEKTGNVDLGVRNYDSQVIITVPMDVSLEKLNAEVGMGGITVFGISAGRTDLETGMGSITVDSVAVRDELAASTGMGDVTMTSSLAREVKLASGMGDIWAELGCSAEDCRYQLEVGLGMLEVDGVTYSQSAEKSEGSYRLEVSGGVGNVAVVFSG